jgi:hypothetical protein
MNEVDDQAAFRWGRRCAKSGAPRVLPPLNGPELNVEVTAQFDRAWQSGYDSWHPSEKAEPGDQCP